MSTTEPRRVHVQGAGKVGRALAAGLRRAGWPVTLRSARRGPPKQTRADVVVLAVRDGQLHREAVRWTESSASLRAAVVLHVAGALDPEILGVLRPLCRGLGQMHPLVSFASSKAPPALEGAYALLSGDAAAVREARRIANVLGMRTKVGDHVDRTAYHAAAWLVAGGAAALSAAARDILQEAGLAPRDAERMLAPLLRSVANNVGRVGLPQALTGVVRRGDAVTLRKHAEVLAQLAPHHLGLYLASAQAQLPMARSLGEVPEDALDALQAEIWATSGRPR